RRLAMTSTLEDKLWTRGLESPSEWVDVARYLIDRLAEYLAQPIVVKHITPVDAESFTCSIHSAPSPSPDPLGVAWVGVLGMEPIQGVSLASATLIPFVLGQRVKVADHASSTIELVFERRAGAPGQWRCEGWCENACGEW